MTEKFKEGDIVLFKAHQEDVYCECGLDDLEERLNSCVWKITCCLGSAGVGGKYRNNNKYNITHGLSTWWVLEEDLQLVRRGSSGR